MEPESVQPALPIISDERLRRVEIWAGNYDFEIKIEYLAGRYSFAETFIKRTP